MKIIDIFLLDYNKRTKIGRPQGFVIFWKGILDLFVILMKNFDLENDILSLELIWSIWFLLS